MFDVLYENGGVVHTTVEDHDYDEEDDEEKETFKESLATSIPGPNDTPAFNLDIKNVFKTVQNVIKTFCKSSVKNKVLKKYGM